MDQSSTCPTCNEPTLATDNWCAACGAPLEPTPTADWSAWDTARPLLAPDPPPVISPVPNAPAPETLTVDPTAGTASPDHEIGQPAAEPSVPEPGFNPITQPASGQHVSPVPRPRAPAHRHSSAESLDFVPLRAAIVDEPQHTAPLARLTAVVRALRSASAR